MIQKFWECVRHIERVDKYKFDDAHDNAPHVSEKSRIFFYRPFMFIHLIIRIQRRLEISMRN